MGSTFDFGYPWWLGNGHLVVLIPALLLVWWGRRRRFPLPVRILLLLTLVWSAAAWGVTRFILAPNGVPELPAKKFLASGKGRVLDLGAGTGRSTLMVLQQRPGATVVALDQFGRSFSDHFGSEQDPHRPIRTNLERAGVGERAEIITADMRTPPFPDASFDAVVSAYAIDHLRRDGIDETLTQTRRVLKPGGELLLLLVENEGWAKFCYGPLLAHGGTRGEPWWRGKLEERGFRVEESGVRPMTLYLLARSTNESPATGN